MTNSFIFHAISDQLVMSTQSTADKVSGLNEVKKFGDWLLMSVTGMALNNIVSIPHLTQSPLF